MANRYSAPVTPQKDYRRRLSNYQYNVMARNPSAMSIRNQTRYHTQRENQYYREAGATTGNIYSAAKWRGGAQHQGLTMLGRYDPYALQRRKEEASYKAGGGYWNNQLMQRNGGDMSMYDRLGRMMSAGYYARVDPRASLREQAATWDNLSKELIDRHNRWMAGERGAMSGGGLI